MLQTFTKTLPIRQKFAWLQIAMLLAWMPALMISTASVVWPIGPMVPLLTVVAAAVIGFALLRMASGRIATPYVDTVVRMEALAAGDTQSPIAYTDHADCVGRMTRSMARFRDNILQMTGLDAQQQIITTLSEQLRRLSDRDLCAEIDVAFPAAYAAIREDFNSAVAALEQIMTEVRTGAHGVLGGANEIRSASSDLSLRNERQAASLEETAAAMDQATASIRQIAAQSADAARAVTETLDVANTGSKVVGEAVGAMETIRSSSARIESIVSLIDGIAFQTNLLALNAGVEAARAGEAGKGFAVVAMEVRTLAQRAAEAANDIKSLIGASGADVEHGVELVRQAGTVIATLVEQMQTMSSFVSQVSDGAVAQSRSLEQVNSAIKDMDRMTQQNAAMVEQSTAAANSLATEAQALGALVDGFRLRAAAGRGQAPRWSEPTAPRAPVRLVSARPVAAPVPARNVAPAVTAQAATAQAAVLEDWSSF